jgi:hypothetical protein
MDFGVWMNPAVLKHKLSHRNERNTRATWSLRRWPKGFVEGEVNRMFVASQGEWKGYFILSDEAIMDEISPEATYSFLFDTRTWTPISPTPVSAFRGFTYKVPKINPKE